MYHDELKEIHCIIVQVLIKFLNYSVIFSTVPNVPFKITVSPEKENKNVAVKTMSTPIRTKTTLKLNNQNTTAKDNSVFSASDSFSIKDVLYKFTIKVTILIR